MTKTAFVVTATNRYSVFADMTPGDEFVSLMYATPTGIPYGREVVLYPEDKFMDDLFAAVCGQPDDYMVKSYR